jgi:hypothetical protein
VTPEVEGIDRMYLNVYQPKLQHDAGVAAFFRFHRGHCFASSVLMDPIGKDFIAAVEDFVRRQQIPLLTIAEGQRKEDVALHYRRQFPGSEGILFVGKAQEKTPSSAPRRAPTRAPVKSTAGSSSPRRWSTAFPSPASLRTSARSS